MKRTKVIFAAIMFLSGLAIVSYPFISNRLAEKNASTVVENYDEKIASMDSEKLDEVKEAKKKYNEQLHSATVWDANGENKKEETSQTEQLELGEGIGYIEIPSIDVLLPIYEGTDEKVLQKGVGHMEQSSYPLGGEGSHSILIGHRGLPKAVLFTNLDKLEKGDCFYLHTLDEVLAYEVCDIMVVEPHDIEPLQIVEGEDYCTLVTCTPYAVNTHRLLVRGTRTEYTGDEEESRGQYQEIQTKTVAKRLVGVWQWLILAVALIIGGEAVLMVIAVKRKKKED